MAMPRCRTCGDPIGFNPKATDTPQKGWFHEAVPAYTSSTGVEHPAIQSRMKTDPDYHMPNPDPELHGPSVALAHRAAMDQARESIKHQIGKQFQYLKDEAQFKGSWG